MKWGLNKLFSPTEYLKFYSYIWGDDHNRWDDFLNDIKKVRESFNRSPNFDEVIVYSLAFTYIPEKAYKACYLETIVDPSDPNDPEKYKYAIIVTPNTTIDDIKPVLKDYKMKVAIGLLQKNKQSDMDKAVDKYKYELGPKYYPPSRKNENIIRDREWYWLKKSGLSYGVILKISKDKDTKLDITRMGVINAIESYKNRLIKD